MRVLLVAYGTPGNSLPMLGWAQALRRRGHEVWLLGNQPARLFADREGFPFVDCDTPLLAGPAWAARPTSRLGLLRYFKTACLDLVRRVYEAIAQTRIPGQTVVAAQGWLFGARLAQERLDVPLATVHLQPLMFGSLHEPSIFPGPLGFFCRWLLRHLVTGSFDVWFCGVLNRYRRELGLAPLRSVLWHWWRSPQLVLGMSPAWFSPPQPDWPPQTVLAGFPHFDQLTQPTRLEELDAFLADGTPPLVFSSPTLLTTQADYLRTSAEIAQRLGRRAVLLSLKAELPADALPKDVRYFGYVPLSHLLPRAAAFVHHGGMGSIGQALAAGIPQLTVPRFLDQPDNSRRLSRLGVSATLRPAEYEPSRVAERLGPLVASPAIRQRCAHYAQLCRQDDCFTTASIALERLLS
jgi:UDP:flavonoid glycosyltransferase YjiC (YdhE family)